MRNPGSHETPGFLRYIREPSISRNLAFSLSLIVFLVLLALLGFIHLQRVREARLFAQKKSDEYIARLSGTLALPMWNIDIQTIQAIGTEFVLNELMEYIRISGEAGTFVFERSKGSEKVSGIYRKTSVVYSGYRIGEIEIRLSTRKYDDEAMGFTLAVLQIFAGSVLLIFAGTVILLRIFLRKPLMDLNTGIEQVACGDFSYRVDRTQYLELRGILDRFTEMAGKVRDREDSSTLTNRTLKEEIAERERAEQVNRIMYEISNAVNTTDNLYDLYRFIHRALDRFLDVSNFFIALYHRKRDTVSFPYCMDEMDGHYSDIENISNVRSLTGEVIRTGRPLVARKPDIEDFLRKSGDEFIGTPCEIWIGVPLKIKNEVIGVIAIQDYHNPGHYNGRDAELLVSVSGQIAIAIQRKRAEEALRESESRFKILFDVSPLCICLIDADTGCMVDVNEEYCRTVNLSRKDIIGRTSVELGFLSSEKYEKFVEKLKRTGEIQGYETQFDVPEPRLRYALMSSRLIRLQEKTLMLCAILDITEQKKALSEKEELQERLSRSRKMEALGLLAGGVAHDLNNILSGIVSYPDLLLMDMAPENPLYKPIETIKASGQRAAAVVSDLLTLARGAASVREILDLNRTIREYLDSPEFLNLQSRYPDIHVEARLHPELFHIRCSPVHLKKVLMNLVANAMEAIDTSGQVLISSENRYLNRPLRGYDEVRAGEYIVLNVSDNGPGIPARDLERIFEPFYTRKVMGRSGTGLGLAVVWNTVRDHDGYIDVKSNTGGTVFDLYFPVTQEKMSPEGHRTSFTDYAGNGERILVVDDEESQRMVASDMLNRLGYQVNAVSSGEKALEYLTTEAADLIILDMIMDPGMNGRETYEQIIAIHPGQRAIIASGFAETGDVRAAQILGAGQYIKKPYTLEKIGMAVKSELSRPSRSGLP